MPSPDQLPATRLAEVVRADTVRLAFNAVHSEFLARKAAGCSLETMEALLACAEAIHALSKDGGR